MTGAPEAAESLEPDYAALFDAIPTPYLVLTPDLLVAAANTAYLATTGRTREQLLGRPVFEVFPPTQDALDADGVPRVQVSLERARDTGLPDTMPIQKYDLLDPANGGFVERFWSLISVPVQDEDGCTRWIVQRAEDVTDYIQERDSHQLEGEHWRRRLEEAEADLYARAHELRAAREAKMTASRQLTALAEVALQLSSASTLGDLTDVVFTSGLPALSADGGSVAVIEEDGRTLHLDLTASLGPQARRDYSTLPLEGPFPSCVAARTGEVVRLPDLQACLAFAPQMAEVHASTGNEAWVALPMRIGARLLGSLTVGWSSARTFSDVDMEVLQAFAAQCAQSLDRIQVRQAERLVAAESQRMSETLQRSMLTEPPVLDSLHITVRYQPAAQAAQVGGDWYDAFVTEDNTTVVIGDVAGHDRDAAAAMGQARNLLRGVAQTLGEPPAAVLSGLDGALRALQTEVLATVVLAQLVRDPAGGASTLTWANAGHPPPLLLLADGTAELLVREADLLLGLMPDSPRTDHELQLRPGDTLLLYTDGLVERRGETLDDGLERLRAVAGELAGAATEQLCDELLARLAPDPADDVALLAVRVVESPPAERCSGTPPQSD